MLLVDALGGFAESSDAIRGKRGVAFELIEISASDDHLIGPLDFLLILRVEVIDPNGFGGIDFILGERFCWSEIEDVETAGDFRAVNVAVVPVGRPEATKNEHVRVDGAALEIGDFLGM